MNKQIYIILFLICSFYSIGQNKVSYLVNTVKVQAETYFGTDALGNYYYSDATVLYKKTADKVYNYQNISLGKISSVDTLNPLLIIVFYSDFNCCVLLDNQFNEIKTIFFNNLQQPFLVSALGLSSQNELWFFDGLQQKIGLINYNTLEYRFISNPISNNIMSYSSNYNRFIWQDKLKNLHSINRFGVIEHLENKYPESSVILGNSDDLIFCNNSHLIYYDLQRKQMQDILLDSILEKKYWLKNGILSTFTNQEILTFQIKN